MVGRFRRCSNTLPYMSTDTGNRPTNRGGTKEEKTTECRGGATRGMAGTFRRTRNTAPSFATNELINEVAIQAHRENSDPADVWEAKQSPGCTQRSNGGGGA